MNLTPPSRSFAGIFLVNAHGELLLQLRDDRPDLLHPNTWTTLGGLIEPGETPIEAARRELWEECGRSPDSLAEWRFVRRLAPVSGEVLGGYSFMAAVDWTLDDIILGEGQAMAWWAAGAVPSLPLNPLIAGDIRDFARSPLREALAAIAPPARAADTTPLPAGLVEALGLRPGGLLVVEGATAGLAARLRAALPDGARLTSSPASHERPDLVLTWPGAAAPSLPAAPLGSPTVESSEVGAGC